MATHEAVRAVHATLTADTVDTVTLSLGWNGVRITNRGVGALWVRFDGTDPAVAGEESFHVGIERVFDDVVANGKALTVKIISAEALAYSVESLAVR